MKNLLLLVLFALASCLTLAEGPKAGTYAYSSHGQEQAKILHRTDSVRATLTPGKNGSFGVIGSWSEVGDDHRPPLTTLHSFKGTLSNKGAFKGTILWISKNQDEASPISGYWNTKAGGLTIEIPSVGPITLKRNSSVTNSKMGHFVLTKTEVGQQPTPYLGWTGTVTAAGFTEHYVDPGDTSRTAVLVGNWDTPPSVLMPGTVIKLGGTATAKLSKNMGDSVGATVRWTTSGSIETLQSKQAYAGRAASGLVATNENAQFQFRIGSGGTIMLYATGGGNISRNPCAYTYTWVPG